MSYSRPPGIQFAADLVTDSIADPSSLLTPVTPEARTGEVGGAGGFLQLRGRSCSVNRALPPSSVSPHFHHSGVMQTGGVKLSVAQEVQEASNIWNAMAAGKVLIDRGLYDLASRSFLHGIRLGASGQVLDQLVEYNYFSRLLSSIDAHASSVQASSRCARQAMVTFAETATTVPLVAAKHLFLAQLLLVSAQFNVGNVKSGANTLSDLKQGERTAADAAAVEALEMQLHSRDGEAFTDKNPMVHAPDRVCYGSLRAVPATTIMLPCSVCPGKFCEDAGYASGQQCTICRKGSIEKFELYL